MPYQQFGKKSPTKPPTKPAPAKPAATASTPIYPGPPDYTLMLQEIAGSLSELVDEARAIVTLLKNEEPEEEVPATTEPPPAA